MLKLLRQRESAHSSEALKINLLKKELTRLRDRYGFDSNNFIPEKKLFQKVYFSNNLQDMDSLLSIYARCPKVRDYDAGMVSPLWQALESLHGEIVYPHQSELDGPNADAAMNTLFITQVTQNLAKIETQELRDMLKLVLTELKITDSTLPPIIEKFSYVTPLLWKDMDASKPKSKI